jgi:hypothetical protein
MIITRIGARFFQEIYCIISGVTLKTKVTLFLGKKETELSRLPSTKLSLKNQRCFGGYVPE